MAIILILLLYRLGGLLNVVVHLLAVVVPSRDLILLCVLLLFPSRFSFPEQRLNGEATTRTIRRASCVIESPLPFSSALCLGFHFLFPFAIAFVIRYRSAVAKKNNDVCLVGVFSPSPPLPPSLPRHECKSYNYSLSCCRSGRRHSENLSRTRKNARNAIRANRFQARTLRLFAVIVC